MVLLNDEEIFARIHKFKLFRKEGNIFIDLYEAILGKPAHKYIAVPSSRLREADKKYFGVGDSKSAAVKDCLKKIKDVPITSLVPPDTSEESPSTLPTFLDIEGESQISQSSWNPFRRRKKKKR